MTDPDTPPTGPAQQDDGATGSGAAQHERWRTDTQDPHRARRRALAMLYAADVRAVGPAEVLDRVEIDPRELALLDDLDLDEPAGPAQRPVPLDEFSHRLVAGVGDKLHELDELIGDHAHRWKVPRMAAVDRNILRLATYELAHEDTRPAIVIDEALELARELSSDESVGFINGVLEAIRRTLASR